MDRFGRVRARTAAIALAAMIGLVPVVSAAVAPETATALAVTDWESVAAGAGHTCGIRAGGSLWCWGLNSSGQLGDGTTTDRLTLVPVGTDTDWQSVVAGGTHTCGIRSPGSLWCWGANYAGQLGDGTNNYTNQSSPTQVGTATDWATVVGGGGHTCGIRTAGTLWCWGRNALGQAISTVTQVGTDSDWQSITAGAAHTCGIRAGGSLWCWGNNYAGQLGDGTTTDHLSPTQVGTDTDWASVNAGSDHTCGIRNTGALWCWGSNSSGQLGDGTTTQRLSPTQVGTATDWSTVEGAGVHSCALKTGSTAWCWGGNAEGELGDGTTTDHLSPTQVGTATDWQTLSANGLHTCGLRTGSTAWCWGGNSYGELGDGTLSQHTRPVAVQTNADYAPPTISSTSPADGATYAVGQVVNANYSCADPPGGSGLVSCTGTVPNGSPIDTSTPGTRVFEVTASDAADNVNHLFRRYNVGAPGPVVAIYSPAWYASFPVGQSVAANYGCTQAAGGSPVASCTGTVASGAPIDTSFGTHSFSVTGTDTLGRTTTETVTYSSAGLDSASDPAVPAGGTVSTGTITSNEDPFDASVTTPTGGSVSIQEQLQSGPPTGYTALGAQVLISAPSATAANPLVLTFYGDGSALPAGIDQTNIQLFKDGVALTNCLGATTVPSGKVACISGRDPGPSGGGDIKITVIAIDASTWSRAAQLPSVVSGGAVVTEGNSGTKVATIPVGLTRPSDSAVSVSWSTFANSGPGIATAGVDYVAASGTVTFLPGQVFKLIPVTVNGDTVAEPDERFIVGLSSPVNATIGGLGIGGVTIVDDDRPALAVNDVSITEGNTGTKNLTFTVTLTPAAGATVTVNYATQNNTATAPSDYTAKSGTLTFNPGTTSQTVKVPIVGDRVPEANETFFLKLSNASAAARIGDASGTATIVNND